MPKTVGPLARNLIHRILQGDPTRRPTVDQILHDDFMTMGERPGGEGEGLKLLDILDSRVYVEEGNGRVPVICRRVVV